jgi:hypothetical protein
VRGRIVYRFLWGGFVLLAASLLAGNLYVARHSTGLWGPLLAASVVVLALSSALAFLFVLIKVIAGPNLPSVPAGISVSKTRKFGIFVGLLATAGLVAGSFLNFQEAQAGGSPPAA